MLPAPTTAMRSPSRGAASHSAFSAVSICAASAARSVVTSAGRGITALAGIVMRV